MIRSPPTEVDTVFALVFNYSAPIKTAQRHFLIRSLQQFSIKNLLHCRPARFYNSAAGSVSGAVPSEPKVATRRHPPSPRKFSTIPAASILIELDFG